MIIYIISFYFLIYPEALTLHQSSQKLFRIKLIIPILHVVKLRFRSYAVYPIYPEQIPSPLLKKHCFLSCIVAVALY